MKTKVRQHRRNLKTKKLLCIHCYGSGVVSFVGMYYQTCPKCNGSGVILDNVDLFPKGMIKSKKEG